MMRAGFGFLWLILGIVTLGIVGGLAYNAGLSAGVAASATETAVAVVPAYGFGFGFGWIFFPILFLFLLFGLAMAFGRSRRAWGGPGGYGHAGYGGWGGRGWDPNGDGARRPAAAHPHHARALARRRPSARERGRDGEPRRRRSPVGLAGSADGRLSVPSTTARMRPSVASGPPPAGR